MPRPLKKSQKEAESSLRTVAVCGYKFLAEAVRLDQSLERTVRTRKEANVPRLAIA